MKETSSTNFNYFFKIGFFLLIINLISQLGSFLLLDWDEIIYAEISRQMLERGDYFKMFINQQAFTEKPPLYFWLMASSFKFFGINEWAARLPSAVANLATIYLLYRTGKLWRSKRLGLVWALVYGFSFFPMLLNRSALIDPWFNFLIATSGYSLFAYYKGFENNSPRKSWQGYLGLAAISSGLAVLTKGWLGLVIPFFIIFWILIKNKHFFKHFVNLFITGIGALLMGGMWHIVSFFGQGLPWLKGFISFQLRLLNQVAEGHDGPFYYHWLVVVVGILPWSGYLLAGWRAPKLKARRFRQLDDFSFFNIVWIITVLIIFSIVQTKLPHYSSSAYIPLSYFVARGVLDFLELKNNNKLLIKIISAGAIIFLSSLPLLANYLLIDLAGVRRVIIEPATTIDKYFIIASLVVGLLAGGGLFLKDKWRFAVMNLKMLSLVVMMQVLLAVSVPLYQQIMQTPLRTLIDRAQAINKNSEVKAKIMLYKVLYFAPFFYQKAELSQVGSYKFKDDSALLDESYHKSLLIITEEPLVEELKQTASNLKLISKEGLFYLFSKNMDFK
ncbi:MAG: glycosyltransferase family 39 protein [SAR324 cluster bacterium]|nr:glycosyltransferase family 39 protein [SAR324 cluster bacterium]